MSLLPTSSDTCTTQYISIINEPPDAAASLNLDVELSCRGLSFSSPFGPLTDEEWLAVWNSSNVPDHNGNPTGFTCLTYFENAQFNPSTKTFEERRNNNVRNDFTYMYSRLFLNRPIQEIITPTNLSVQLQLQNKLTNACSNVVGGCQSVQEYMCRGCNRGEIASTDVLRGLCGCYPPPLDPSVYHLTTLESFPECDPLCVLNSADKILDHDTGKVRTCESQVCVIDNISLNAVNSTIGNPTLGQYCQGCSFGTGPPCKCIFDASVPAAAEILGISGPGKFEQSCPGAICLEIDTKTNTSTVVECSTTTTSVPPIDIISIVPSWIWILVVIILIVGLFVILSVSYHRKNEVVIYHDKPNVSSGLDTYAEIIDRSSLTKY
jgi:hypothetical protein